jgi:hypothetical protein
LNQIWRFLSQEIDKQEIIEQKIRKMEEDSSDADEQAD